LSPIDAELSIMKRRSTLLALKPVTGGPPELDPLELDPPELDPPELDPLEEPELVELFVPELDPLDPVSAPESPVLGEPPVCPPHASARGRHARRGRRGRRMDMVPPRHMAAVGPLRRAFWRPPLHRHAAPARALDADALSSIHSAPV
jgi:hypothetical protein